MCTSAILLLPSSVEYATTFQFVLHWHTTACRRWVSPYSYFPFAADYVLVVPASQFSYFCETCTAVPFDISPVLYCLLSRLASLAVYEVLLVQQVGT